MWDEFVVGSRPRSERFLSEYSGFPFPQKPTFLNSNSIWIVFLSQQEFGTHLFQNFAITFNFSYHFDISSLSFIVIIIIFIIISFIIIIIIIIIINLWISIFLGIF